MLEAFFRPDVGGAVCENPQRRTQKPGKTSICVRYGKAGMQISFVLITAVKGHYPFFQRRLFHPMLKNPGTGSKLKVFIDNASYPKWPKSR